MNQFLTEEKIKFIYAEFEKTGDLNKKSVRTLCDKLKKFINEKFDNNPNRQQIESVCKAVLIIFPCLKREPSFIDGIVSVLEHSKMLTYPFFIYLVFM